LVCLLAGLGSLALSVRAEEKPQLWAVWEIVVKPPQDEAYYKACKDEVAILAKYKYPYDIYAYYVSAFRYMFVTPLKNYADMDNMYQADEDFAKKAGDEYKNLRKAFKGTYESIGESTWYGMPDLGYEPASPRLKPEEEKFILDDSNYVEAGKGEEFEGVLKEMVALCKSKNVTEGWQVYVCDIGPEMPVYVVSWSGKDIADVYGYFKTISDMLGEEGKALMAKANALLRKEILQERWYLPELSYIVPKEKK